MFRRKITHQHAESYLKAPISAALYGLDHDPDEWQAKAALRAVLNRSRELLPHCRQVFIGRNDLTLHDSDPRFVTLLLRLSEYLCRKQYVKACEEFIDVLHFFHIEDRRILYTLISLLEEFL